MKILYFTATGNSLHVAKSLGGESISIPQMIKEGTYEFTDDKIGIVFPVHAWVVNSYVADFLSKVKFNCDYLFAIATYGIYSGGVASHLVDIANQSGYTFAYINKVKMVDNYLLGFKMDKQIQGEHKKHIEEQIAAINVDISSSKHWIMKESAANRMGTDFMRAREEKSQQKPNPQQGIKKIITVEDSCVQCGVCVNVCPVDNISLDAENGKIKLQNKCFMCFACVQNCPTNAIHLKHEMERSRYRNRHVTLQEIVESNE